VNVLDVDFLDDVEFTQPYGSNHTNAWYSSNESDDRNSSSPHQHEMGTPQPKQTLTWQTDQRVIDLLVENLKPSKDMNGVMVPIDSDVHKHTAEVDNTETTISPMHIYIYIYTYAFLSHATTTRSPHTLSIRVASHGTVF
jgi:hypothetical protein